jgi:hypothetical protein
MQSMLTFINHLDPHFQLVDTREWTANTEIANVMAEKEGATANRPATASSNLLN